MIEILCFCCHAVPHHWTSGPCLLEKIFLDSNLLYPPHTLPPPHTHTRTHTHTHTHTIRIPLNVSEIAWPFILRLLKLVFEILIIFATMLCYNKFVTIDCLCNQNNMFDEPIAQWQNLWAHIQLLSRLFDLVDQMCIDIEKLIIFFITSKL